MLSNNPNQTVSQNTPLHTASLVFISFVISIILSTIGFFVFASVTGFMEDAGFGAIILVLLIPYYILVFAVPLTLLVYFFLRRIKFSKAGTKGVKIIALIFFLLIFGLPASGYVFDRYIYPHTSQYKNNSQLQLYKKLENEQYVKEDYKTTQIVARDESVWLPYTDESNNFSFKYMPIWHYKKEDLPNGEYKLTFFYNDMKEKIGTKNSEGTDVFVVELLPDTYEYSSLRNSFTGVATDKDEISVLRAGDGVYAKLSNGKGLKFSRNSYNGRQYNSEYNNRILMAISTTIESADE
jgi:hypothetical protein